MMAGRTPLRDDRLPDRGLADARVAGQHDGDRSVDPSIERIQDRDPLRRAPDQICGVNCHAAAPTRTFGSPDGVAGGAGARPAYADPSTSRPDRGFAPIPQPRSRPSVETFARIDQRTTRE